MRDTKVHAFVPLSREYVGLLGPPFPAAQSCKEGTLLRRRQTLESGKTRERTSINTAGLCLNTVHTSCCSLPFSNYCIYEIMTTCTSMQIAYMFRCSFLNMCRFTLEIVIALSFSDIGLIRRDALRRPFFFSLSLSLPISSLSPSSIELKETEREMGTKRRERKKSLSPLISTANGF